MGKLRSVFHRVYSDYFMPSRLGEYENIIKELVSNGYEVISFREYCQRYENNHLRKGDKIFISRHDIDTDIKTAKEFFDIEKKYNVQASYYFRLATLDTEFMKAIESYGSEASYHFEEIAQYCKDNRISEEQEVFKNMEAIRLIFERNFLRIERKIGIKIKTVCAHGDFVNRALGIVNNEITKDIKLRQRLGISFEAYDKEIIENFDAYISDTMYPTFYKPESIFNVIGKHNVICMLTHPRHWRTNFWVNTLDNLRRLYEGVKWRV